MPNTSIKSSPLTPTNWIVLILTAVIVTSISLYFTKAVAVNDRQVGTLSITAFDPVANDEFVILSVGKIADQQGTADLTDWSIQNQDGSFVFDLSSVHLTSSSSIKLCGEDSTNTDCDYRWIGRDVFANEGDTLRVIAYDSTAVIELNYDTTSTFPLNGTGEYIATVLSTGDKIAVCDTHKNGTIRPRNLTVKQLVYEKDEDIAIGTDIIPPFVYEEKKKLGYHPGVNWPAGKDILTHNCKTS